MEFPREVAIHAVEKINASFPNSNQEGLFQVGI